MIVKGKEEEEIERIMKLNKKGLDIQMERIRGIMEKIGNKNMKMKNVINIEGKKGKGQEKEF